MLADLPQGFKAAAVEAAFKKPGRVDLGLIYSELPCELAAMFTVNRFAAAPVQIDRKILALGLKVRAIIANSGQANACTGQVGLDNCLEIQRIAASLLNIEPDEILLISTGVIGAQFDMDKWRNSLPRLTEARGTADADGFTHAFMTTDAFPKYVVSKVELSGGAINLAIMAKGAGMICPNMATMLCVALTDLRVERQEWQSFFNDAVNATFNRVTVDGDTSTNDTILGLANGASGITLANDNDRSVFAAQLQENLARVAYMLVQDGEGASRVLHIAVNGAKDNQDAEKIARAVGNSQLVKTAIYGGDANWGRIINAVGYSGAEVNPHKTGLTLCGIERFRNGQPVNGDKEEELARLLRNKDVAINITVGNGPGEYDLLASDLGHEYVTLNSDYRS